LLLSFFCIPNSRLIDMTRFSLVEQDIINPSQSTISIFVFDSIPQPWPPPK
jgi:hypothetical protein